MRRFSFVVAALAAAVALVVVVAPFADSSPDGLEAVAADQGFLGTADDSATAGAPLAGYAVDGVGDERATVSLAGVIGVAATFAVTSVVVRTAGRRSTRRADVRSQRS